MSNWVKELFDYHEDGYLTWKVSPKYDIPAGSIVGYKGKDGRIYVNIRSRGKVYMLHRLIFEYHFGWCPNLVDHIDRDNTNNRIENLRPLDKRNNMHNSNKSLGGVPYRGVSYDRKRDKFAAYLKHKGKRYFLGYFLTAETAHQAYLDKKMEVVGYV